MKRQVSIFTLVFCIAFGVVAQTKADDIVGVYSGRQGNDAFRVKIERQNDGTYRGRVVWMEHDRDADGNKILDRKNPDKRLRKLPADQAVLFTGLRYDAGKRSWGDTKIYDPQRGLRAHLNIDFTPDGRLRLKGSLMGISEIIYWERVR